MDEETPRTRREERAAHAKAEARKQAPKKVAKNVAILAVVALVIGGGYALVQLIPPDPGTGHIHPAFRMYDDGQELSFAEGVFDYGVVGFARCHIHTGESQRYLMHIEGKLGIELEECFREWGMELRPDRVRFHEVHGRPARANNETHEWQLWTDLCSDGATGWFREPAFQNYKPVGHTRMLITYAPRNATVESLQTQLDSVPTSEEIASVAKDYCGSK